VRYAFVGMVIAKTAGLGFAIALAGR